MISCSARSIGPAAAPALSGAALRVHSAFPSTLNLEAQGTRRFVSLCGPAGGGLPHAVVLERPEDFTAWDLAAGSRARLADGRLHLRGERGDVVVDLAAAKRPPPRALPSIPRVGAAHRACATRLAELQRDAGHDLRMDALWNGEPATTPLGARLRQLALALGDAARPGARSDGEPPVSLREPVAGLVGLGAGLTPSGDDFLCGFIAAARAGGSDRLEALQDAAAESLGRTASLSAFLVRCAIEGLWPVPLLDLAEALAGEREAGSLAALGKLCQLGHSSGADLATGFVFGLEALVPRRAGRGGGDGGAVLLRGERGAGPTL